MDSGELLRAFKRGLFAPDGADFVSDCFVELFFFLLHHKARALGHVNFDGSCCLSGRGLLSFEEVGDLLLNQLLSGLELPDALFFAGCRFSSRGHT